MVCILGSEVELNLGILGFGKISRNVIDRVKRFPGYGIERTEGLPKVHIHMVYVNRETWSYGKDLVVPILDKENNLSRTYKDGLEAIRQYETTVSRFEDWVLEHVSDEGDLDTVIDCTSYNEESVELAFKVINASKSGLVFYTMNKKLIENHLDDLIDAATKNGVELKYGYESVDELIVALREQLDGNQPWEPVEFSEVFMEEARKLSEKAAEAVEVVRKEQLEKIVKNRLNEDNYEYIPSEVYASPVLRQNDIDLVKRFIVGREGNYYKTEYYDNDEKCYVIEHGMLNEYFTPYIIEPAAARFFLRSDLKVLAARCFIYDSIDSYAKKNRLHLPCSHAISVAIEAEHPWVRIFESLPYNMYIEPGEALGYSIKSGLTYREPLGTTENKRVTLLMFHLGAEDDGEKLPSCTCYDN